MKGLTGRALGEAVIEHVLTYPEQHDQSDVVCGTTACIAGWAVLIHYGAQDAACLAEAYDSHGVIELPSTEASHLLEVDPGEFREAVFGEMDRDTAISNLKHLLDTTYSEPTS